MSNEKNINVEQFKASKHAQLKVGQKNLSYTIATDTIGLIKEEKVHAKIFYTSYVLDETKSEERPITFVFNGGPGASSAYLHMGALGTKCVLFNENGESLSPPAKFRDNPYTWLSFTDLVFIDPVGTGLSHVVVQDQKKDTEGEKIRSEGDSHKEYYAVEKDLNSLCEFIRDYLSKEKRWSSPCYIAGESYGGYRVARLAKKAQEEFGIGLNGVVVISPALEWMLLEPSDYDVLHWVDVFPSLALAAFVHGKSKKFKPTSDRETVKAQAEHFATNELALFLIQGDLYSNKELIFQEVSDYLGLPITSVQKKQGRIHFQYFCRELLKDEQRICGFYDASITAHDAFNDRDTHQTPDPTLAGIGPSFTQAINAYLRSFIGLNIEKSYVLLSKEINNSWKDDCKKHALYRQIGATDDLRYGMALNPNMNVFLTHGDLDLVTPYFSSKRIVQHMKLNDAQKKKLTVKNYTGGHMFYLRESSKKEFFEDMQRFYKAL